MKSAFRITAFTLVVAAAVAGNTMTKTTAAHRIHEASVPGPIPVCNPFTQKCPTIR